MITENDFWGFLDVYIQLADVLRTCHDAEMPWEESRSAIMGYVAEMWP